MAKKTKKQIAEEISEIIGQADQLLNTITADNSVPRYIKKIAQEAQDEMHSEDNSSPAVSASNAISLLDDLSQDPNCPLHTRTRIYQILSLLEQIKDN